MRKAILIITVSLLALSSVGCKTFLSPLHWYDHSKKIVQEFHTFQVDLDRTVFGLHDIPIEDQPY